MRILLAEDDPMLGDGLRAGLRQLGFQVDWVRDGMAAERELATGGYAAAVLDLGLPLKDGIEVLIALRERKNATPVLVLTAYVAWTWAPTTTLSSRWTCMNSAHACAPWCAARMDSCTTFCSTAPCSSTPQRAKSGSTVRPSCCPRASSICCMP